MRGSLLINFNEIIDNRTFPSVQVEVNGQVRDIVWSDIDNLYTTYIYPGDVVTLYYFGNEGEVVVYDINRTDYTTDSENGDFGIKDTYITGQTSTGTTITFTATTRPDSYRFNYVVDVVTNSYVYYEARRCSAGIIRNSIAYPYGTFELGDRVLDPDITLVITGGLTRTTVPAGSLDTFTPTSQIGCSSTVTFIFNYHWTEQRFANLTYSLGIRDYPRTLSTNFVTNVNSISESGDSSYSLLNSSWIGTFTNFEPFITLCETRTSSPVTKQGILTARLTKNGVNIGTFTENSFSGDTIPACINAAGYGVNCGTQTFAAGDVIIIDFTDDFNP